MLELNVVRVPTKVSPENDCEDSREGTTEGSSSGILEEDVARVICEVSSVVCDTENESEIKSEVGPAVIDRVGDKVKSCSCNSVAEDEGVGESALSEVDDVDELNAPGRSGVPVPGISEVKEAEES